MFTKEFITAGKAIFTLEVPKDFQTKHQTAPHYTFKIQKAENKPFFFIGALTGPDNTKHYSFLGLLLRNKEVRLTEKSKFHEKSWQVRFIKRIIEAEIQEIQKAGFNIHHEGMCGRCGRTLTVPESVESGFGPECIRRL
jgi:hypothetical protein